MYSKEQLQEILYHPAFPRFLAHSLESVIMYKAVSPEKYKPDQVNWINDLIQLVYDTQTGRNCSSSTASIQWDDRAENWINSDRNKGMFFVEGREALEKLILPVPLFPNHMESFKKCFLLETCRDKVEPQEMKNFINTGELKMKQSAKGTMTSVKDQAKGRLGVAVLKHALLKTLSHRIGFTGRLFGRHKAISQDPFVVAGVAIVANMAAQKYSKNETIRDVLQNTQDQAVFMALDSIVKIDQNVGKFVDKAEEKTDNLLTETKQE